MLIIDAEKANTRYWKDLFEFRELIVFLTWRNLLIRYKQTAVGIMWVLLRPLLAVVALTVVFGKIANLAAHEAVPYPLLVLSGILPWQLFSNTLADCSESIVTNSNLVSKIYFPRVIVPLSSSFAVLCDTSLTLLFASTIFLWYGVTLNWHLLFFPVALILCWTLSFGVGLWIAAFNVKYRDFRYVIPFVLQFGLYITPVGFSSHLIQGPWKWLFSLNPLVGIIDLFRFSLLGETQTLDPFSTSVSVLFSIGLLLMGTYYFRKVERHFADII